VVFHRKAQDIVVTFPKTPQIALSRRAFSDGFPVVNPTNRALSCLRGRNFSLPGSIIGESLQGHA
jgi:hypothetical protein